ncbi:MAG: response regulator [Bacteroidota bacterium]
MLTNLVKNAIKFTQTGSVEFGYEKQGDYLEFFVKDTGVGIPQDQQEIIFTRFRQGYDLIILIAEDDEDSTAFITTVLKKFSKEVLKAKTCVETVKLFSNNPSINLILMDIRMPKMDGYEATRQIRRLNKDVIIIAQTAYGLSGDRQKAIDAGCNEYLSKPIDKDELLRLMQKHFQR